jgi:hypothetical protein
MTDLVDIKEIEWNHNNENGMKVNVIDRRRIKGSGKGEWKGNMGRKLRKPGIIN